MSPAEAVAAIADACGGSPFGSTGMLYRFPTVAQANLCKGIVDAISLPHSTGEVCGRGILFIDPPLPAVTERLSA